MLLLSGCHEYSRRSLLAWIDWPAHRDAAGRTQVVYASCLGRQDNNNTVEESELMIWRAQQAPYI